MKFLKKNISILLIVTLLITGLGVSGSFVYAEEPTYTGTVKEVEPYLNVRKGPGTNYDYVGILYTGDFVTIYGEAVSGSGLTWYKISYNNGYAYVATSYIINVKEIPKYDYNADFETNLTEQGFPESYKVLLRKLHAEHPNWIFLADHLTMTWQEAVAGESKVGVSLVSTTAKDSWKSMAYKAYDWNDKSYISYDTGGWVTAEREVIEYYLEPRNFLNENGIFMFVDQSFNSAVHTKEGIEKIVAGTFMANPFPEDTHDSYASVLLEAGRSSGVSPYVLAASIIIEQGANGKGASISGTNLGFEGYYNFFNVGAWEHSGNTAVKNGLIYAKGGSDGKGTSYGRPWNSRAKSIIGGAQYYATGYVKSGQDTLYYKKFNVVAKPYYDHQYMTNVAAAYNEALVEKKAYSSVNADAAITFSIPVYKDMPETNNTALPTSSGANNYYLTDIKVDSKSVDNFDKYVNEYELVVPAEKSTVTVTASTLSGALVSGTGNIPLNAGVNKIDLTVTAASGKKAVYTLSIFRQEGGQSSDTTTIECDYNISSYVSGITPGTTVSDFMSKFAVKNGTATVVNASGETKTEGNIATGDKVVIYNANSEKFAEYCLVIYGDVTGDGTIDIIDLAVVQMHLLQVRNLEGSYLSSMDVNHDDAYNIVDLAVVQMHLLRHREITQ